MKQCPNCNKMNGAYAENCKYCGNDIKWAPDDGSDSQPPPNFSAGDTKFRDSGAAEEIRAINSDKASLDDIYEQLEDIKERMTSGVNLFDVTMPFGKMVVLIIKLTFASIPAALIMGLISSVFWLLFGTWYFRAIMRSIGMH